ncbi:MAG: heavy-metal-associated domain-containing protein [Clostridiales bacterium]|jgi:Cu2+-exporting ATPase|nr:heavy-metal-associated domain-containing protein [Clostridiales bacterium]
MTNALRFACTKTMKVEGMHCGGCENRLKRTLEALAQVDEVVASHTDGTAVVTMNEEVPDNVLKKTVEDAGGFTVLGFA